jgi:hypothetical protein
MFPECDDGQGDLGEPDSAAHREGLSGNGGRGSVGIGDPEQMGVVGAGCEGIVKGPIGGDQSASQAHRQGEKKS